MWHYQIMKRTKGVTTWYELHEYYEFKDDDNSWTEEAITVSGVDVKDLKQVLKLMLKDAEEHGVRDYETGELLDE